ncbi:S8 family serine peptidase [Cytobacillus horneckiae]|uniref:S8 family serine peptidase n=1 Tax=Cytobacillus horneckiae TaxID=549687 RepID=UPI003D9A2A63
MKKVLIIFSAILIVSVISSIFNKEVGDKTENEAKKPKNWTDKIIGYDDKDYKKPIKIAILDSGINKDHKDFKDIKFVEYNAINKSEEKVSDDYGHGTAVAGIIAAKGEVIKGVVNNPILYDVKVLNEKGEGKIESVVEGINWSIKNNVDIINISFGFSSDREDLKKVINKAYDNGITIIAASGNTMGLSVDYPANYENVLSISSLDKDLQIDTYSATGKIDYSAPGVDLYSTDKEGGYSSFTGTSFASAYATGVISSIMSKEKIQNKKEFDEIIEKYTVTLGEEEIYGKGILTLNPKSVEDIK